MLPKDVDYMRPCHAGIVSAIDGMRGDKLRGASPSELDAFMRDTPNVLGLIHASSQGIDAFAIFQLNRESVILFNVGVIPERRRQGLGTLFLNEMKRRLGERRRTLQMIVSEQNYDAQKWLQANQVRAVRIVQNAFDKGRDGYAFEYQRARLPVVRKEDEAWVSQLL